VRAEGGWVLGGGVTDPVSASVATRFPGDEASFECLSLFEADPDTEKAVSCFGEIGGFRRGKNKRRPTFIRTKDVEAGGQLHRWWA